MPIAVWSKMYETGNSEVDGQHQHLFSLINELQAAIGRDDKQEVLVRTLEELVRYTIEHFTTEERLMKDSGYPDFQNHKTLHADLIRQVIQVIDDYRSGTLVLATDLLRFLAIWLADHIQGQDMRMVAHLKGPSNGQGS
jgi:hemerythrin